MPGKFFHEERYRGRAAIERLGSVHVCICGAGALGSNLADTLVRQGLRRLRLIDRDRVEEQNVGTQIYTEADVGAWKVEVLRSHLFRVAGVEIEAVRRELTAGTARKLLRGTELAIDTFDNSAARAAVQQHCRAAGLPCLHVGLSADYGEVIWDEHYRVPDEAGRDVCDYPLARNLVLLAVAIAAEEVVRYVTSGDRHNWSVTLDDFSIQRLEL